MGKRVLEIGKFDKQSSSLMASATATVGRWLELALATEDAEAEWEAAAMRGRELVLWAANPIAGEKQRTNDQPSAALDDIAADSSQTPHDNQKCKSTYCLRASG